MFKLLLFACGIFQLVAKANLSPYKAAVMEYAPVGDVDTQTPAEVMRNNLDRYGQLIAQAGGHESVDIIVFPEYGITTLALSNLPRSKARPFLQLVPAINSSASPALCDVWHEQPTDQLVFAGLSCFARQSGIYVVANIGEVVPCKKGTSTPRDGNCPDDGAYHYNTNVAFDRQGRLVARYRKSHLFLEPPFQEPLVVDHSTFMTDFGVRFGLLICFDIMYYEPALTLYYKQGIKDFIFPTAWVDELPFLTAVQVQEGWSRFLGVNLLASGYHLPANGQLGSGIYGPERPINYTFNPDSGTQMIIGQVPSNQSLTNTRRTKEILQERSTEPHQLHYENMTGYSSLLLETGLDKSSTLFHDGFRCTVSYSSFCPSNDCVPYRLVAFSGFRDVAGEYAMATQLCGLVACPDADSVKSCSRQSLSNRTVNFLRSSFRLEGYFSSAQHVYPTATTNINLQLLPAGSIQLKVGLSRGGVTPISLLGDGSVDGAVLSDILAIGLYGRAYDKDPTNPVNTIGSSSPSLKSLFSTFTTFIVILLLRHVWG